MINVVIYLKKNHNAKKLVKLLLSERLVASASIDEDNVSYKMEGDKITEQIYTVITAQSKALLFNELVKLIENEIREEITISATPIVASNGVFSEAIRSRTIAV